VIPSQFLEPRARLYRLYRLYCKRGYYVRSPRRVLERLTAAAIKFALIGLLCAGVIIVAALIASDVLDIR
jgi:hypothetical protein